MQNNSIFSSLKNVPWVDFLTGLFIPLNILYILLNMGKPFLAIIISVSSCVIAVIVLYIISKNISLFPVITGIMILISFFSSFLSSHKYLYVIIEGLDNSALGLIFLATLFTGTPFILHFVPKEAILKIPEKIKNTPYFMRAWRIVTLVWGITNIITALIMVYCKTIGFKHVEIVDYLMGWPVIILLLFFSVTFPRLYWKKNWQKIDDPGKSS